MSNEWKMVRLGDICEYIRNGANIKQSDNAGGTPITRIETLSNDKFNRDRLGYADIADDKYSKYYLNNHDILMSHINSEKYLGRAVLYTKESEDETIIHGMNLLSLRTLNDKVIAPFLAYYFATVSFKSQIAKISKKSVNQASFSVSCLNKVNIPLPSIKRQREIAAVLDKANELVEKRKAQLAELDLLAESIFYDMFGDPVTNEKGWEKKKLNKIGLIERGKSKHRPRNAPQLLGGKYPLIQTGDVANAELYITNYNQTYSEIGLTQSKMWEVGTLCITIAANIAKTAILKIEACFPDSIVGFTNNEESNCIFVHFWFSFFQEIIEKQAPEVAQKNINLAILSDLDIILPPLPLQQNFAVRIEKIEEQKAKVKEALKESENLFQCLMQDMFNPEYHNS